MSVEKTDKSIDHKSIEHTTDKHEKNSPKHIHKELLGIGSGRRPDLKDELKKGVYTPELTNYTREQEKTLKNILHWKEGHEKTPEQVKNQIVDRILKAKYWPFYKKAVENWQTPKEIREDYLKKNWTALDKKITTKTKDWKEITETRYKAIIDKNKDFAKLNTKKNPDFTKQLLTVYWTDTVKQFNSVIWEAWEKWKKLPTNLEEFDEFIKGKILEKQIAELKKEDPEKTVDKKAVEKQVEKAMKSNPNYVKSALSKNSSEWQTNNFEKGTSIANKQALTKAIDSLPEGSKARLLLTNAEKYLDLSEKKPEDRKKLQALLWFDPAKTPWCKWFFNAIAKKSWIQLNSAWNLGALSWQNDWRKLDLNKEKPMPGDEVVVRRKWTTSAWTPGWHIWYFIWMSTNWHPIIIWWNQWGWRVSIKEERRPIVSINRIIPQEEEENDKTSIKEHKNWNKKN